MFSRGIKCKSPAVGPTPLSRKTLILPDRVRLREIALAYLGVGATAFGGPVVIQKLRKMPASRKWLTEKEMDEGLSLVQLYPGTIGMDLVAYTGYRLRGATGAVVATTSFALPSFLLILLLSWLYFTFGTLPWMPSLFLGLEALVIGILCNLLIDLGRSNLRTTGRAIVGAAAFGALLFKMNAIAIVFLALALGALFLRPKAREEHFGEDVEESAGPKRWLGIGAVTGAVFAAVLAALAIPSLMSSMGLVFFKIGSVAFGNGATILPLIQADVVNKHQWLTPGQFADGIAMGQITPGPFLITAAFVGYKMAGAAGAALATFAIFSPSIAMTLVFTELFRHVRHLEGARGALAGVMASFVGLLALMVIQLGSHALKGPKEFIFAALALAGVRYLKLDAALVFAAGLSLWAIVSMI
ncbi:chromate efflux transporter [bacterium]|nr:MAG: chromate efflux transporter [bacterium]